MVKAKILKLSLDGYGCYLGRAEGCFEIRDKNKNVRRYPHFENEISECILKTGNYVSVDALVDLALWNVDTYIMTQRNRVVAVLKNLEDDSHVKTRLCQYQAFNNSKGVYVAKQIAYTRIESQNQILRKYGLRQHDLMMVKNVINKIESKDLKFVRRKLLPIEGYHTKRYFKQIFQLFPEKFRPKGRVTFKAYDGLNNIFNFGYYVLKCRVHKALLKAKLEPYLGFLHSVQFGKPSLVCDFLELYRYLIDDFLIERYQKLHKNDFVLVTDFMMRLKKISKRIHLCEFETNDLANALNTFFNRMVEIPRIKIGRRQTIDTLISEEALLFAKYLRNEVKEWIPRIVNLQ